jgi:DNA-binding NarL/FixJ family response regulator
MPLRVLLADDHELVRQGLRALLERHGFAIVGEAAEGRTAVTLATELQPDIVVLDVAMPILNGVGAAEAIARAAPKTRVILLTALNDGQFASSALRAGVRGFVLKLQNIDDLVHAIHEVNEGGLYVSPGMSQAVFDVVHKAAAAEPLSPRERQVVQLVAEGKSTKQIAELLHISAKTAEFHRGRVMDKLDIHDTAGLVRYAVRHGLVVP